MNQLPSGKKELQAKEKVKVEPTFGGKYRVFAAFVICVALLSAAFAVSSIWKTTESGRAFFDKIASFFAGDEEEPTTPPINTEPPTQSDAPSAENPTIPEHAVIVRGKDLSYLSLGEEYYLNETDYTPDIHALLSSELGLTPDPTGAPLVLVVHTHTVESYLSGGEAYMEGSVANATYSDDAQKNMLAVGKVLADQLNERGISTLQCTVTHTGKGMSLQGAYGREAESVKAYLAQYPSIRLVIDLHRDSVMNSEGEYIRTEVPQNGDVAQVMAVVGSDANGTPCEWERNLALALQLRRELNGTCNGIGRPVYLRQSSFNQELAEYSLLLEIGTGANSIEQAKRTAQMVGDALANMLLRN